MYTDMELLIEATHKAIAQRTAAQKFELTVAAYSYHFIVSSDLKIDMRQYYDSHTRYGGDQLTCIRAEIGEFYSHFRRLGYRVVVRETSVKIYWS